MRIESALLARQRVAASFSKAAGTYDAAAAFQRKVGEALMRLLPSSPNVVDWIDLGCGTGYFSRRLRERFPAAAGVAVDIAEGMLCEARRQGNAQHVLVGDAECLPLREGCADLLFSSLAVQWCDDLPRMLAEARRVLRLGGRLAFSSLCAGTLYELDESWKETDTFVHVNRFRPFADYRQAVENSGLRCCVLSQRRQTLYYADLRGLARELKALGAHNLNAGRPGGMTGRKRLQVLQTAYERYRQAEGLPATYQVVYALLEKT